MELTVIQQKIYEIRGQKVMLDFDLARFMEQRQESWNSLFAEIKIISQKILCFS